MIQRRGGLGLALVLLQGMSVPGNRIGEELQGNAPFEPGVFGLIHDPHAPAAQLVQDAKMRNGLTDHGYRFPGHDPSRFGIGEGYPRPRRVSRNLGPRCPTGRPDGLFIDSSRVEAEYEVKTVESASEEVPVIHRDPKEDRSAATLSVWGGEE